jgi:chromosome segregation protein
LELQGFKSFAHRTVFEFTPGVTAVVGPNGSGKSNVADAVRWVLGEHSFRNLRARQGEDLIFAGSQLRSRVGLAEAVLVFDNASGWLPIAFAEVSVGRRAYRSGENEYFINDSRVRRRDVVELLVQGGVSASAYVIIAQGLVDEILSLRPEDRRRVLEEAAGIRLYQDQRDAALAKLQSTQENLTRVRDILTEITPRLDSLRRQAQRAEEYRSAAQELEGSLLTWYGHQWHLQRSALGQAEESARRIEGELGEARQRLDEHSASSEARRAQSQALGGKLEEWRALRASLWSSLQEERRDLAIREDRWGFLRRSQAESSQELTSVRVREASAEREAQEARQRVNELEVEWRALGEVTVADRQQLEESLLQMQELAFRHATTAADLRVQLAQARDRQETARTEIDREGGSISALQPTIAQGEEEVRTLREQSQALGQDLTRIEQESSKKSAALAASTKRTVELSTRQEENERALARLEAHRAVAPPGSSQALAGIPGMLGAVGELLEIPQAFQRAIAAALGPLAQALVLERWADAREHLEEINRASGAIFPLDLARPAPRPQLPADAGVVGLASDLVRCEAALLPLCRSLLGRTLIVRNLEDALRLYQSDSTDCDLVTTRGELLAARGTLHLPPAWGDVRDGEPPETRQEVDEVSHRQAQRADLLRALEAESGLHREAESSVESLGDERRRAQGGLREVERSLGEVRRHLERHLQEVSWHETILQRLQVELSVLNETQAQLDGRLSRAVEEESYSLSQLELLRRRTLDAGRDPDVTAALLGERLSNARTNLATSEARFKEIRGEMDQRLAREQELAQQSASLELELSAHRGAVERLQAQLTELDSRLGPAQAELANLTQVGAQRDQEILTLREAIHRQEMERAQALGQVERQKDKLASLQGQIETDLESVSVSWPGAAQLPLEGIVRLENLPEVAELPSGIDRKVRSMRHTLRRIGGVDPEALTEYRELEARHSFLSTQAEDLRAAMAQLKELIARLDGIMRERFLTSFQTVAAEFEQYFANLFKGGSAKLLLTDPEDLEETGLEIVAQPPGKRRQNVAP